MKFIEVFCHNGFDYLLLSKVKDVALYSLSKKSAISGKYEVLGYEVHKVRKKWSYDTLKSAENGFKKLVNNEKVD